MYQATQEQLQELKAQHAELILPKFDLDDAWDLGSAIVERARAEKLAISVDIRRDNIVVFRASLPGAVPDQQYWIEGKTATAARMGKATLLLSAEFSEQGLDPVAMGWLPRETYIVDGGCVPIQVQGVGIVALLTISGLEQSADHEVAIWGLRGLLEKLNAEK